jgi:hypothetical protein
MTQTVSTLRHREQGRLGLRYASHLAYYPAVSFTAVTIESIKGPFAADTRCRPSCCDSRWACQVPSVATTSHHKSDIGESYVCAVASLIVSKITSAIWRDLKKKRGLCVGRVFRSSSGIRVLRSTLSDSPLRNNINTAKPIINSETLVAACRYS